MAARGAATLEPAIVDVPPEQVSPEDVAPRSPEMPGLVWSRDIPLRGGPALRIPKALLAQTSETAAPATVMPQANIFPEFGTRKSYAIPAMEIVGMDFLINRINKKIVNSNDPTYDVTVGSIRRNFGSSWVNDNDPYSVNQFAHPYQGSIYHGFARSAGLSYWESSAYTFLGSAGWEIAGETTRPSKNDQVASGIAGSFLGEALFRISSLVLEHGDGVPKVMREVVAAAISPATGFNRLAFGDKFSPIFSSHDAIYYSRLQVGLGGTTHNVKGPSTAEARSEVLVDYSMEYGLPGKPDYTYTRPFDYFSFQATASSANAFENILTRGLLLGKSYDESHAYRGVYGVFGSYDYISPQVYRVSSTALSVGSVAQRWLTQSIALQGTALLGAGYAAVGTIKGLGVGDYHYGVAPQTLLAARIIFGERASIDLTAREYFVSKIGSGGAGGNDNIARADVSFTYRLYKQHSIAVKYLWNRRDSSYSFLGDSTQERSTVGIFYSYVGHDKFGAVEWRDAGRERQ